ncbi:glycosyltransferase family 2 protein [Muriicola sp. Z0-33]|uniref:glycosyltransferase family 2 protein n=1 Tax=Muriicola sp. Z0-33 TaxID=2816957 RepID=UPI002238C708|nr:glycosyltransferase family 2 protein [Muriicola sp. Z0-33]MCW5515667.1 glycosyltransferase family 2 protein [Muriicola sp. Z0-33]
MNSNPTISIIIATYNRSGTIERCISSILRQSFSDLEIIVVDDGSTDNTLNVLKPYEDKIRLFKHPFNKGVCAAKNTGLNQIKGDWFAFLDDDDELLPHALETMLNVPKMIDAKIDAVTCNCINTSTNEFSGIGLSGSGYIDLKDIVQKCKGEYWGITKTSLLGNKRFNEDLPGVGNVLWYRIDNIARRYYLHEALRIYHMDGNDHVTQNLKTLKNKIKYYRILVRDDFYWDVLYKYNLPRYKKECFKGKYFLALDGDKQGLNAYRTRLRKARSELSFKNIITYSLPEIMPPGILKSIYGITQKVKGN